MSADRKPSSGRSVTLRLPSTGSVRALLARAGGVLGRFGGGRIRVVLIVVVLLLAVGDVLLVRAASHDTDVAEARADALSSARTRVPAMLSYSHRTIDADLAIASGNSTGAFRDEYATLLRDVVAPNAVTKKITTRAAVTGAAVRSADDDTAVILVFLTQTTAADGDKTPKVTGSRIDVEMTRTAKGWFVSGLKPV